MDYKALSSRWKSERWKTLTKYREMSSCWRWMVLNVTVMTIPCDVEHNRIYQMADNVLSIFHINTTNPISSGKPIMANPVETLQWLYICTPCFMKRSLNCEDYSNKNPMYNIHMQYDYSYFAHSNDSWNMFINAVLALRVAQHYDDVIMGAVASQISSLSIV